MHWSNPHNLVQQKQRVCVRVCVCVWKRIEKWSAVRDRMRVKSIFRICCCTLCYSSLRIYNCRCSHKSFNVHFIHTNPQIYTYMNTHCADFAPKNDKLKFYQQKCWKHMHRDAHISSIFNGIVRTHTVLPDRKGFSNSDNKSLDISSCDDGFDITLMKRFYYPTVSRSALSLSQYHSEIRVEPWAICESAAESWFWLFNDVPYLWVRLYRAHTRNISDDNFIYIHSRPYQVLSAKLPSKMHMIIRIFSSKIYLAGIFFPLLRITF